MLLIINRYDGMQMALRAQFLIKKAFIFVGLMKNKKTQETFFVENDLTHRLTPLASRQRAL